MPLEVLHLALVLFAAASDEKVPRLRRFRVFGSSLRE